MELASQLWNPSGKFRLVAPDGSYEIAVTLLKDGKVEFEMAKETDQEADDDE